MYAIIMRVLGFVGGTGKEGRGLALRLAAAGHHVVIGSRDEARARAYAAELEAGLAAAGSRSTGKPEGAGNRAAIDRAELVFLTLPWRALDDFLADHAAGLAGKVVVDVVVPLHVADGRLGLAPIPEGSVSARIQRVVPATRVVGGFKNIAAARLLALPAPVEGDILLAADDRAARHEVADLVADIPNLRAVDAGPLANAAYLECLTALQLDLNRLHRAVTSIRVLGLRDRRTPT